MTTEKFDVKKAENLAESFRKNLKLEKANFLYEISSIQLKLGSTSILNRQLLLTKKYSKKMVISVLSELGYKNIEYDRTNKLLEFSA